MRKQGFYNGRTRTIIKDKNGEIVHDTIENEVFTKYVNGRETFFMAFASTVKILSRLDKMSFLTMMYYAMESEEGEMRFVANDHYKTKAAALLGIGKNTLSNAIQRLYKQDCIRRVSSGVYLINPKYFWKGTMNKRPDAYENYLRHQTGYKYDPVKSFEMDDSRPEPENNANL